MTVAQARAAGYAVRHDSDGWVLRDGTNPVLDARGIEGCVYRTRRDALGALAASVAEWDPSAVDWEDERR